MQYTTTTYAFFLQPLLVPSSFSVNNPLCPVNQTHTSILETHARDGKKDVRHNCGWVLVCDRASFPRDQEAAALAHKHTHIYIHTHAHMLHTLCLELRVPLFTKEQGCFMCV